MFELRAATSPRWIEGVRRNFDHFLKDHAACERKAAMTALALVSQYREHPGLCDTLIELAREELEHYHEVHRRLCERGLTLGPDLRNVYAARLAQAVRKERQAYLLDRLLVAALIEARSCERLGIVAEDLEAGALKDFYQDLVRSESRHHGLYLRLAREHHPDPSARLSELLDLEASLIRSLPVRPVVH